MTKTAKVVSTILFVYDGVKLYNEPNLDNSTSVMIDGVSYAFWEVGVVSAYSQTMYNYQTETVRPEMEKNLQNNVNPTNGIFMPGAHWSDAGSLNSAF